MRTKNENNVYNLTCRVTGKVVGTNPKQFNDTVARYGVSDEIVRNSYVSREGRSILRRDGLTAAQAVEQFGIDSVVASNIKNLAKEPVNTNIVVEVPANAVREQEQNVAGVENSVDANAETFSAVAA